MGRSDNFARLIKKVTGKKDNPLEFGEMIANHLVQTSAGILVNKYTPNWLPRQTNELEALIIYNMWYSYDTAVRAFCINNYLLQLALSSRADKIFSRTIANFLYITPDKLLIFRHKHAPTAEDKANIILLRDPKQQIEYYDELAIQELIELINVDEKELEQKYKIVIRSIYKEYHRSLYNTVLDTFSRANFMNCNGLEILNDSY